MPNAITSDGITTATQQELLYYFTLALQQIYGPNIDLSSSSPDGQLINIFIQSILDIEDLTVANYNARALSTAFGTQLDQLVQLIGIQRQAGTYTVTPISITTSQPVTLYGLNQTVQPVYTVADNSGNQWQLQATQVIGSAGTNSFNFQSATIGAVPTIENTITVPVSVVLGVTGINNPSTYSTLGSNEESDAALKIRAMLSTQFAKGYYNGLFSTLANITGVTSVNVYENYTGTTDVNGVPGHSIWCILAGTGAPASIAQGIYGNRTAGCGMKGQVSYNITQADGSTFTVYWDNVIEENLFLRFTATSINGITPPNIKQILTQLPTLFIPSVGATVNVNTIQGLVQQIDPNTLVTNAGFSTSAMGSFTNTLVPTTKQYQFVLESQNINITPIVMLPTSVNTVKSAQQTFTAYGGTQLSYVYSISANTSGGSINASTGVYTAGTTIGTDTILVTDSGSNTATSTVNVT